MELDKIISNSLSSAFPRQTITFSNKKIIWEKGNHRKPQEITESIKIRNCRLQSMSPSMASELGYNLNEYKYYRLFLSDLTPRDLDRLDQMGATEFIYDNYKYIIVGTFEWNDNHWRELYCYRVENIAEEPNNNKQQ